MGKHLRIGKGVPPSERWPVAWYNPKILWRCARELVASFDTIRNGDPRELFPVALPPVELDCSRLASDGSLVFDFVSDLGDSGNATYAVAQAMFASKLEPDDRLSSGLPEGRPSLLVLGGDMAYPGASAEDYQCRFIELYEAAQSAPAVPKSSILAIPQNHDWFDSTSTFKRYFLDRASNSRSLFGMSVRQNATYFAAELAHGWWILGFDFALNHDLDRQQFESFRSLIERQDNASPRIPRDAKLILVYPEPFWTKPAEADESREFPKRYQLLERLLTDSDGDCERRICIRLAGDWHHYSRDTFVIDPKPELGRHLITCGAGGAFTHSTHASVTLATKVECHRADDELFNKEYRSIVAVGPVCSGGLHEEACTEFVHRAEFPNQHVSKRLAFRNVFALFKSGANNYRFSVRGFKNGNIMLCVALGLLYWFGAFLHWAAFSSTHRQDGMIPLAEFVDGGLSPYILYYWFRAAFVSPFIMLFNATLIGLCFGVVRGETSAHRRFLSASAHFLVHWSASAILYYFAARASLYFFDDTLMQATARGTLSLLFGMFFGGLIFGTYFALMAFAGWMINNAYSTVSCEDYKGFLRFQITQTGRLRAWFVGCEEVPRLWKRKTEGETGSAWAADHPAKWRVVDYFESE